MLVRLNMGLVWEVLTGCFLASFGCGRYGGHCANPKVAFKKTGSKIHSIRKRYSFSSPVSELTRNNIFFAVSDFMQVSFPGWARMGSRAAL